MLRVPGKDILAIRVIQTRQQANLFDFFLVAAEGMIGTKYQSGSSKLADQSFEIGEPVLGCFRPKVRARFHAVRDIEMEIPAGMSQDEAALGIASGEIGDLVGHGEKW